MSENSSSEHLFPGVPFALGSALLFGATPALAKNLLDTVHPVMLAGLLYLGAGIGLLIYRLARNSSSEAPLHKADVPWLALAILTGGVVGPVCLMLGLSFTSAATGSLLLNLVEGAMDYSQNLRDS